MDEDRVPLCTAYLAVSGDPFTATRRSKEQLWGAVHDKWTDLMKKGPFRVMRSVSALEKQFKKTRKGVSTFTSHYLSVKNMQTTGNLSEEDIISGAVARYCSLDIYEAIRNDREKDKRQGKTAKRKAKLAHCKWLACWRVLGPLTILVERPAWRTATWRWRTRRMKTARAAARAAQVRPTRPISAGWAA